MESIKKAVEELKTAAAGDNVEEINAKTEALNKVLHPYIEKMYQQQAAQDPNAGAGAQPGAEQAKKDDDVVDAEFTEVKKDQ